MKHSPQHIRPAAQVNRPIVGRPGDVVPWCRVRNRTGRRIPDPNRGLVRKAIDAFFDLIGHHPGVEAFERKQWD